MGRSVLSEQGTLLFGCTAVMWKLIGIVLFCNLGLILSAGLNDADMKRDLLIFQENHKIVKRNAESIPENGKSNNKRFKHKIVNRRIKQSKRVNRKNKTAKNNSSKNNEKLEIDQKPKNRFMRKRNKKVIKKKNTPSRNKNNEKHERDQKPKN